MSYGGGVARVLCSSIGLMCVAQSCCVITMFRVASCTSNVSAVGLLMQGVDTACINQSFKKLTATSHSLQKFLLYVAMS
jgi:hypothetical protein